MPQFSLDVSNDCISKPNSYCSWVNLEAAVQKCSVKKLFLEISQNSQENACAIVFFSIKLKTSGLFSHQTSGAASVNWIKVIRP